MIKDFRLKFSTTIILSTIFLINTFAQCNVSQKPALNNPKSYRSMGNRSEGFIQAPVSEYSIKFVGFTLGRFKFKLDGTEKIEISSFENKIVVQASSLLNNSFYSMDACIDPKSKLIWPVKDFLLNTSLSCNNLGLLASASGSLKEPYIPVKAQGVLEKAEDNTPTVKIISSTRLSKIRWRVLGQNTWNYVKGFNFPGRMGIEFQLNNSIKGELAIEIEGEMYSKKGEWLALDHPVKVKIP